MLDNDVDVFACACIALVDSRAVEVTVILVDTDVTEADGRRTVVVGTVAFLAVMAEEPVKEGTTVAVAL